MFSLSQSHNQDFDIRPIWTENQSATQKQINEIHEFYINTTGRM